MRYAAFSRVAVTDQPTTKLARLRILQEAFGAQLPDRLAAIRRTWIEVQTRPEDEAPRKALYRLIHSLAGAAVTFSYQRLGEGARLIEDSLRQRAQASYNNTGGVETIGRALGLLEALIAKGPDSTCEEVSVFAPQLVATSTPGKALVYVLEDNHLQAQEIVAHAALSLRSFIEAKTGQRRSAACEKIPSWGTLSKKSGFYSKTLKPRRTVHGKTSPYR